MITAAINIIFCILKINFEVSIDVNARIGLKCGINIESMRQLCEGALLPT
jgi:hypothetical protein